MIDIDNEDGQINNLPKEIVHDIIEPICLSTASERPQLHYTG